MKWWTPTDHDVDDDDDFTMMCSGCGNEVTDYYMVRTDLWANYGAGDGFLHLKCLEKRIGRAITREDFSDAPINRLNFFPTEVTP